MDKLQQVLMHLEAAELALQQADPEEPFEDKKDRIDSLLHIGQLKRRVQILYGRKAGAKDEAQEKTL